MLLDDAKRFIVANRAALEQAPQLIYSSLVFAPRSSMIRRVFWGCVPDWISQVPTNVPESWSDMDVDIYLDGAIKDRSEVLLFSPDGTKVAADGQVWDAESGHVQNVLSVAEVKGVSFSLSNHLQYVDWHGRLITLDLTTREETAVPLHLDYISAAVLSHDATRLAICAIPSDIIEKVLGPREEPRILEKDAGDNEAEDSELEHSNDEPKYGVEEVTSSPYGDSSKPEGQVNAEQVSMDRPSDSASSQHCQSRSVDSGGATSGESVSESELLPEDNIFVIAPEFRDSATEKANADCGESVDCVENDSDWLSASEEDIGFAKRLIVWDSSKGILLQTPAVDDPDPLLSLSSNGSTVAWSYVHDEVKASFVQIIDIVRPAPRLAIVLGWPALRVDKIMLSPSGDRIVIALLGGEIQIRNTFTGELEHTLEVNCAGLICSLAFSPDEQILLVAVEGDGLTLFNLSTGRIEGFRSDTWLTGAAFSHDGLKIAVSSEMRHAVEIFKTTALKTRPSPPSTSDDSTDDSTDDIVDDDEIQNKDIMSPDSSMLATVSRQENEFLLWDISTGHATDRAPIRFSLLYWEFSPDSTAIGILTHDYAQYADEEVQPEWEEGDFEEGDFGELWLEVWKVQFGKLQFSFRRGPLANWELSDDSNDGIAKVGKPWAFNHGGARVALAPKVKVRDALTMASVPLIEEWDVATGTLIHTHAPDTPFLVRSVACSPVGFFIHYCGINLVRGMDEIRHFEAWGGIPATLTPEAQSRVIQEEHTGWHRKPHLDKSILAPRLKHYNSRSDLTDSCEWVRLGDCYTLYIPHYYRGEALIRMPSRSGSGPASNDNEAVIASFNPAGTLTAMKIDMDRYLSSSLA